MKRRVLVTAAAAVACAAPLAAPGANAAPYQPLAFLVGHCWKGNFAGDAQVTDEHCFSWIYGGKFVRDEHTVHRAGASDHHGESIYLWDGSTQRLEYLYIESDGGFSRGTLEVSGAELVFPPTSFLEQGTTRTYRSRWLPAGADAYDVVTEFEVGDRWVPGFKLHMERQRSAGN